jgi:hypothetical protein
MPIHDVNARANAHREDAPMGVETNPRANEPAPSYPAAPVMRTEHTEDRVTRLVEQQSAKVPSNLFLFCAISAMTASFFLEITGRRRASRFVGMWPGPLLTMGVYNKLVKTFGAR